MSILIKGIEMPTDHSLWIVVNKDGTVEYNYFGEWKTTGEKAVSVPSHGRLIDADALIKGVEADAIWEDKTKEEYDEGIRAGARVMMQSIRNALTIIPAEECE